MTVVRYFRSLLNQIAHSRCASAIKFLGVLGVLTVNLVSVSAQDAPRKGAFVAYQCTFQSASNTAQINAVLMGGDGQPIPTGTYQVAVAAGDNPQLLDSTRFKIERLDNRPPLQMILVLDITDTVPIEQIVSAISGHLSTASTRKIGWL